MKSEEKQFYQLLENIGLPIRPSYNVVEVCCILGIGKRTFHRLIAKRCPNNRNMALNSFKKHNERRVSFSELAAYIERNNTFRSRKLQKIKN